MGGGDSLWLASEGDGFHLVWGVRKGEMGEAIWRRGKSGRDEIVALSA